MTMRQPNWDIDLALGAQSELWVADIRRALAEKGTIEVKHDQPSLKNQHFYVEYECRGRDGVWRPSGIATTKSKLYFFTFGDRPGGVVVATDWLTRAARLAYKRPIRASRMYTRKQSHARRPGFSRRLVGDRHAVMRRVILESPYAGDVEANVAYARAAVRHSLLRGEAPMASHLLYTQPGVLRDEVADERQHGIDAGLAWRGVADASVVYTDMGVTPGMEYGIAAAREAGLPVEFRSIKRGRC